MPLLLLSNRNNLNPSSNKKAPAFPPVLLCTNARSVRLALHELVLFYGVLVFERQYEGS